MNIGFSQLNFNPTGRADFSRNDCPSCNMLGRLQQDSECGVPRVGLCSPDPFTRPGHYPVRGVASFGQDYDCFEPNVFHCDLTGREWSGDPEPVGGAFATSIGAAAAASASAVSGAVARPAGRPNGSKPNAKPVAAKPAPRGISVKPLAQSNGASCGQTSVAMSVNYLTGKRLTDRDVDRRYGFGLLQALQAESKGAGVTWYDAGNFSKSSWPTLEKRLNKDRTPVLIGLNGPVFSPSGRGHIVTLLSIDGDKVRYADPADGKIKTTTRRAIEQAGDHPDGKFMFCATRNGRG